MRAYTRIWRHFDIWLLASVVLLTISGVAMIQSAIAGNETLAETVPRQVIFAITGLIIVLIVAAIDYRIWSALSRPIYIITILALAFLQIAGQDVFGSQRWFRIGPITIQPSEFAKIFMILVLADFLSRQRTDLNPIQMIMRSLLLVLFPSLLILIQPDLSTTIVLVGIWLALVWAVGLPIQTIGILALVGLIAFLIISPFLASYFLNGFPNQEDFTFIRYYQMERVANFLFPNEEETFGNTYNILQALISIGSGGWFGKGYGQGTQVQLRFLKVRHTDFIFSAMAEEFGFVGSIAFILVIILVVHRCLRGAKMARDGFGALICYGVAFLIFFQSAFNIGMNLNLFPVSGIPLPFFSSGGSSLLASLLGIGLVESVILRHKQIEL